MKPVDQYFLKQKEPYQSIMLYLRSIILNELPEANERFSYKIPFYYFNKKPMLYLNVLKGTNYVDIAFMDGKQLETDFPILKDYNKRKRVRSIQLKKLEDLDHENFIAVLNAASKLLR